MSAGLVKLLSEIDSAQTKLKMSEAQEALVKLKDEAQKPDFWSDNGKAQVVMKEIAKLESKVNPWQELEKEATDLKELADSNDMSLKKDLEDQLNGLQTRFAGLKTQLKFNGPYDDHAAILSIFAGAGGVDAQDWAEMLMRMYLRWAENNSDSAKLLNESRGDEAGIKSTTIEIDGINIYGQLKSEHGVHRLVRLSPFNADHLRQTSFAKVEVIPKIDKPDEVQIDEKDLKIDVFRSGGHGGQSVNTTDSAVRITHLPTGITVSIQNERSQQQNKETAMTIIRSKLAQLQLEQHKDKISDLKGANQSAEWGNQIRSYVLHPYKQVKDLRSGYETTDIEKVLDGQINPVINSYLEHSISA